MSKKPDDSFNEIIRPLCYVLGGIALILANVDKLEFLLFSEYNQSDAFNFTS